MVDNDQTKIADPSIREMEERITSVLSADIGPVPDFVTRKPFLAHYTSVAIAEQIIRSKQLWLSHPLYMNDFSEVGFALERAIARLIGNSAWGAAFPSPEAAKEFHNMVQWWKDRYIRGHFVNTFLFSLSEVGEHETDGLLSMWRSYGGDGKGAALVFDTSVIAFNEQSPFIVEPVSYFTSDECDAEADRILGLVMHLVPEWQQSQDHMLYAANGLFERFKIFALLTKHKGFAEEREWRIIYLAERDREAHLTHMIDYSVGEIVQPKLKFPIEEGSALLNGALKFDELLYRVILGPSGAPQLSRIGFLKVLNAHAKVVRGGLHVSSIPYRHRLV